MEIVKNKDYKKGLDEYSEYEYLLIAYNFGNEIKIGCCIDCVKDIYQQSKDFLETIGEEIK